MERLFDQNNMKKRLFLCSFHAVIFLWKPSLLYQSHDRKIFAWMGAGQTYWLKYAWNFSKRSLLYLYKYLFYCKGVKWLVLKIIIGCNRHTNKSTFQKTVQKPARISSELNGKLCSLGKRGKNTVCLGWFCKRKGIKGGIIGKITPLSTLKFQYHASFCAPKINVKWLRIFWQNNY